MSGIEIAGLIIGVTPIIISALSGRDGKILMPFRKRSYVARLTNALVLQKQTVVETVRLLIMHSGCTNCGRSITELDDDPIGYLCDRDIQRRVLDFLGESNNVALNGALEESNDILKRLARQLSGLVPAHQGRPDDLLGIIEANRATKWLPADLLPQIKLMLGSSEIKKSIEELDAITDSLYRFSRLVSMNRSRSLLMGDSPRKAVRLAKVLRRIRGFAIDLHTALYRCCCNKDCHEKHMIGLLLEDRVDTAVNIQRSTYDQERTNDSTLVFHLVFGTSVSISSCWHEIPIQVLKQHGHDAKTDLASPTSCVKLVVPETTMPAGLALIDNFCSTVNTAKQGILPVTFVLLASGQMGTINTNTDTIVSENNHNKITLKAILSDSESIQFGIGFSLQLRMLLALRIASNLLQLFQTRWLHHAWCKETVYFSIRPTGKGGIPSVDFSRVFVTATIDSREPDTAVCSTNVEPKVALLELGILLLEIWHQTTLETHFRLERTPTDYYIRLARAVEWLQEGDNPPPDLYESAVSYCIGGMLNNVARLPNWDVHELWNGVCESIIEPLSKNCKQWRQFGNGSS